MNKEKSPVFQSNIYRDIYFSLLFGVTLLVLSREKDLTDAAKGEKSGSENHRKRRRLRRGKSAEL
jgi:hypothetical protein